MSPPTTRRVASDRVTRRDELHGPSAVARRKGPILKEFRRHQLAPGGAEAEAAGGEVTQTVSAATEAGRRAGGKAGDCDGRGQRAPRGCRASTALLLSARRLPACRRLGWWKQDARYHGHGEHEDDCQDDASVHEASGYRVEPAGVKGVAAKNALRAEPAPLERPVAFDRFESVVRARWGEATLSEHVVGQGRLICTRMSPITTSRGQRRGFM